MKKKIALISFLLLALIVAGCSAAKPETAGEKAVEEVVAPYGAQPPAEAAAPTAAPAVVATAPPAAEAAAGGKADAELSPLSLPAQTGRMVIKDAILDLLVQDTDRAMNEITDLAANQGGYLLSSRSWYDNDYKYATVKIGVPSANYERTLTLMRALGIKVLNETSSGQDVSAEYNDLQSRLTNLEATAARVRTFLDEAKTVEESLRINQSLSDLEGQIEQVKGQMKFYEGRAAYSTIEANLTPFIPTPTPTLTPTPTTTPTPTMTPTLEAWRPGQTIQSAARAGRTVWQAVTDALIWIFILLWPLFLLAGIIILIVWLRRRKQPKRVKAPVQRAAPPAAPPSPPAAPLTPPDQPEE